MSIQIILESLRAFHVNALNSLIFSFSNNWCLMLLVMAAAASVIMGLKEESVAVIREEQNIL